MVKRLHAMRETWVQSLGWEDPLEKKMATHSSMLAWSIPWTKDYFGGLKSLASQRVRKTFTSLPENRSRIFLLAAKNSNFTYFYFFVNAIIFKTKSINFCFIDYAKAFDCVDHNKLWKIPQKMVIPDHLTCLLRNLYAGQEATVRTGHGTTDWFQIGKGVLVKAVYCHPAYLTYMQSTSWETFGWRKHKLESRLPREISITSDDSW